MPKVGQPPLFPPEADNHRNGKATGLGAKLRLEPDTPAEPEPVEEVVGVATPDGACPEPLRSVINYLKTYIVLPEAPTLVTSAWVMAAWLPDLWDRFPHLAVTSPEKRCGKTLLLDLLYPITLNGMTTTNISPQALYRIVQRDKPTLLMDELQSISRKGSEASQVTLELLNAGIGKSAKVIRCGGTNMEQVHTFNVYGPKAFALIGELDGVLGDRCLNVKMKRKTKEHRVERYRSKHVDAAAVVVYDALKAWAEANQEAVAKHYDEVELFDINNDRMADLLAPLQAVLMSIDAVEQLSVLAMYASKLDEVDKEQAIQSTGVQLLWACRNIFSSQTNGYVGTDDLIGRLTQRPDEQWHRFNPGGRPIGREGLAGLLRPFGIKSAYNKERTHKGYYARDFSEAWERYLLPI